MKLRSATPIPNNVRALAAAFLAAEDKLQQARNAARAAEQRDAPQATVRRLTTLANKAQANRDRIAAKYHVATGL